MGKYSRLKKASGLIEILEPGGGMTATIVKSAKTTSYKQQVDEDLFPEETLQAYSTTAPGSRGKSTEHFKKIASKEDLEFLATDAEIISIIERIISYIIVKPNDASSFAHFAIDNRYIGSSDIDSQAKKVDSTESKHSKSKKKPIADVNQASVQTSESSDLISPEDAVNIVKELQDSWQTVETLIFGQYANSYLGIQAMLFDWFTYGKLYFFVIREDKTNKMVGIEFSMDEAKQKKFGKQTFLVTPTSGKIVKESDIYVLDYSAVNPIVQSYLAGIQWPFNTYKSVERSRIANAVMMSAFRTIYSVPTKGLPKLKARARLSKIHSLWKRVIHIDRSTGTVTMNGENNYAVNTELWSSETNAGKPTQESPNDGNPALNNMDIVSYFNKKFYKLCKLPLSKYEAVDMSYLGDISNVDEDERQFKLYINIVRTVISKVFIEIVWSHVTTSKADANIASIKVLKQAILMKFYDELENKTELQILTDISERVEKIEAIINAIPMPDNMDATKKALFMRDVRIKLIAKYIPELVTLVDLDAIYDLANFKAQKTVAEDE